MNSDDVPARAAPIKVIFLCAAGMSSSLIKSGSKKPPQNEESP